ncbi:MAG: hypothetical protein A2V66_13760 [Ignavibacteria bacterium RBG_13_36_8]|nr:MAG: hypothetical protein A2V66_13760 [Ignavibacteria bacterium RBG_13_36_8]
MTQERTIDYISSIIGNPYLASSIYQAIDSAIKNPNIIFIKKTPIGKIFQIVLENSIRDIQNHPRGVLFQRLIEYGSLNPSQDDLSAFASNTVLSDEECISAVNFIYGHIINRFKGDLAELLAIKPCIKLFKELKKQNKISSKTQLCFGDYIKEYQNTGNLAKGADGLIIQNISKNNSISVKGVIEIKSMYLPQNKLLSQINKHITRLSKGIKLGNRLYCSKEVHCKSSGVLRIMVIPSLWEINKDFEWLNENNGRKMIFPAPDKPKQETSIEEVGKNLWKITLDWSKEAIEQAAYDITFNYMSEVGKAVYNSDTLPRGWAHMSQKEAGYNSIKEKLYFILARPLSSYQYLRAVKLYNVYSFGYPLGIDSREMLWPEDIYK